MSGWVEEVGWAGWAAIAVCMATFWAAVSCLVATMFHTDRGSARPRRFRSAAAARIARHRERFRS